MNKIKTTILILSCLCLCASCGLFINRTDKHGERHGKWKHYWDKKNVQRKGKYKHGLEVSSWKHYDLNGTLTKIETYNKARDTIFTSTYFPNKKIESKGQALLVYEKDSAIHYYWQGLWFYFNEAGDTTKKVWYEKGTAIKQEKKNFKFY